MVLQFFDGEKLQIGLFAGSQHVEGDEGGRFVGGSAAVFLEPLFVVDALGAEASDEIFTGIWACFEKTENERAAFG
jgi:hypothetical protein